MADALDQRIKELEAQLKEQELRDKTSKRPLFAQSFLTALPIVLTIGLGFVANFFQSRDQFAKSLEQQRLKSEVDVILKASEVPTSLSPADQDAQRARNLLWYAQSGYLRLPAALEARLRDVGRVPKGEGVDLPVTQSEGGTAALELMTSFEGYVSKMYPDPATGGDPWAIGYGHSLTSEEMRSKRIRIGNQQIDISNGISEQDARALLRQDLAPYYARIDELVTVPLKPLQKDALASLLYNVGRNKLEPLLSRLNSGDYDAVPNEILKLSKLPDGRELPALRRRREAEIELWRRAQ